MHGATSKKIRQRHLSRMISDRISGARKILDIGCGDGLLLDEALNSHPKPIVHCCDIIKSYSCDRAIFSAYDGATLPYDDRCFDLVLLTDVLHHCRDPACVFGQALRVCSERIIIKDHISNNILDEILLKTMDFYGNVQTGGYDARYLSEAGWRAFFQGFEGIESVKSEKIQPYGPLFSLPFPRGLHVIHTIEKTRV